jgi:hypothetical protein
MKENYDKAIELIKAFNASSSPHRDWVARGLMIWSDIFKIREDYFMAKATLESIIKYYPDQTDGVIDEASEKLADIEELEMDEKELKSVGEIEINLNNNEKHDKLFETDPEEKPIEILDQSIDQTIEQKEQSNKPQKETLVPDELNNENLEIKVNEEGQDEE